MNIRKHKNTDEKIVPFPEDKAAPASDEKPEAEPPRGNNRFLVAYALVLFAVAFLLVLMSWLAQERNRAAELNSVRAEQSTFSISAMQSIQNLQTDNDELRGALEDMTKEAEQTQSELDALREEMTALQNELASLRTEQGGLSERADTLTKRTQALTMLIEMERLASLGRNKSAKAVADELEEAGLVEYLPHEAEEGRPSPREEYDRIRNR